VERAQIALEPQWFPAVENRGEGVFLQIRADAVKSWLAGRRSHSGSRAWHRAQALDGGSQGEAPFPGAHMCYYTRSRTSDPVTRDVLRLSGQFHSRAHLCRQRGGALGILLYTEPGRGWDARRIGAGGAAHRESSAVGAADGSAVLQRPDLFPAFAGTSMEKRWLHGRPATVARWSPRPRARCAMTTLMRARRAGAWRPGAPSSRRRHDRGHSRSTVSSRKRVASALESALLTMPYSLLPCGRSWAYRRAVTVSRRRWSSWTEWESQGRVPQPGSAFSTRRRPHATTGSRLVRPGSSGPTRP